MSNGLALRPQTEIQPRDNWDTMQDMAKKVSASGLFKGMTEPQVLTLMLLAQSEGLHPIKALMRYHIVEGRPSMRADTIQAEFQHHGGRVRWVKSTANECTAEFSHPTYGKQPFTIRLTLKEFIDSGVALFWDRTGKQQLQPGWKRFPAAMLRARAITAGIRAVLPGVIMGIYSPEEIDDDILEPTALPDLEPEDAPEDPPPPDDDDQAEPDDLPEPPPLPVSAIRNVLEDQPPAPPAARERTGRAPVGQTVADLREHQQTAPQAAPRIATTEWGQWITDALEDFHRELAMCADLHPQDMKLRTTVRPQQVMNALIKAAIQAGFVEESAVLDDGKRNPKRVSATLGLLWKDDPDWIVSEADQYLARKMIELLPKQAASAASDAHDRSSSPASPE